MVRCSGSTPCCLECLLAPTTLLAESIRSDLLRTVGAWQQQWQGLQRRGRRASAADCRGFPCATRRRSAEAAERPLARLRAKRAKRAKRASERSSAVLSRSGTGFTCSAESTQTSDPDMYKSIFMQDTLGSLLQFIRQLCRFEIDAGQGSLQFVGIPYFHAYKLLLLKN
jgi:hypothetical protein